MLGLWDLDVCVCVCVVFSTTPSATMVNIGIYICFLNVWQASIRVWMCWCIQDKTTSNCCSTIKLTKNLHHIHETNWVRRRSDFLNLGWDKKEAIGAAEIYMRCTQNSKDTHLLSKFSHTEIPQPLQINKFVLYRSSQNENAFSISKKKKKTHTATFTHPHTQRQHKLSSQTWRDRLPRQMMSHWLHTHPRATTFHYT